MASEHCSPALSESDCSSFQTSDDSQPGSPSLLLEMPLSAPTSANTSPKSDHKTRSKSVSSASSTNSAAALPLQPAIKVPFPDELIAEDYFPKKSLGCKTCNAFMIYRKVYTSLLLSQQLRHKMIDVSRWVSAAWANESPELKNAYKSFAREVDKKHRLKASAMKRRAAPYPCDRRPPMHFRNPGFPTLAVSPAMPFDLSLSMSEGAYVPPTTSMPLPLYAFYGIEQPSTSEPSSPLEGAAQDAQCLRLNANAYNYNCLLDQLENTTFDAQPDASAHVTAELNPNAASLLSYLTSPHIATPDMSTAFGLPATFETASVAEFPELRVGDDWLCFNN